MAGKKAAKKKSGRQPAFEKVSANTIYRALVDYYEPSAVVTGEVPNATGFDARRRIDAVAVGCWPSRGLYYHAIEIKVSRQDLKRELANPEKAEAIATFCDQFFIAAPAGLCDPDILPPAWGLLEYKSEKIRLKKPAPQTEAEPLNRSWVAALVRSVVQEKGIEARLARVRDEASREAWAEASSHYEREQARLIEHAKMADEELGKFKQVHAYWGNRIPSADRLNHLMRCIDSLTGNYGSLNALQSHAKKILDQCERIESVAQGLFPEPEE